MADERAEAMVAAMAEQYQPRCCLSLEALVEAGRLGLARARERFDPQAGQDFESYAEWWVKWAITRAIAGNSSAQPM